MKISLPSAIWSAVQTGTPAASSAAGMATKLTPARVGRSISG